MGTNENSKIKFEKLSNEVVAAISMALFELGEEIHDIESTILTIRKVDRRYSPWSSKFLGMRQLPRR